MNVCGVLTLDAIPDAIGVDAFTLRTPGYECALLISDNVLSLFPRCDPVLYERSVAAS